MNTSGFIHRWKVRAGEPHDDDEEDREVRPDDEWLEAEAWSDDDD